jgi:DNA-binding NarL/FixJ family response regulator
VSAVGDRLRIVVVDDHHLFRAGVRAELAQHLDVVGEAAAPAEAVAVIAETRPDASFSPRLAAFVLQAFSAATQQDAPDGLEALTPREREVLHHLARGYAYKRIGLRLGTSARTVETHVGAVLRKLQLSSRHEVSHWAARRGLIDDDDA